ncbi:hypothetical protein D3C76_1028320 [compost metagenome]
MVVVGAPDDVAGGIADRWQWAVDGCPQTIHVLHAMVAGDTRLAALAIGKEQCVGLAPVAFE